MEHTDGDDCKTTAAPAAAPSTSSCLPLLVFEHQGEEYDDDDEYNNIPEMLMFSISQQSLHRNMEHELLAKNVCTATPQGWVLLTVPSPSTAKAWLWNPQTGDKLSLPDIGEEHVIPGDSCNCLLSHKNVADPGCVVVLVDLTEPNLWFCRVDGSSGWMHYSYHIGDYAIPPEYRPPTKKVISSVAALQGKLYFISSSKDMCTIDFLSSPDPGIPEFHYFDVRTVDFPEGMNSGACWLVESQEELFQVCICFLGFDPDKIGAIHVYKMDFSKEQAWCRVHDIGDSVFLLPGADIAASCPEFTKKTW